MISKKIKDKKGVTLVALVITVTIMLILTSAIIYNLKDNISIHKLTSLQNDIMNLRDKVSSYYAQYGALPIVNDVEYINISKISETGVISEAVDTGAFYVIKLSSLDNLTLTYGEDFEEISKNEATTAEQINSLEDLYIINEDSHNIFYVEGVTVDNQRFHTDYTQDNIDKASVPVVEVKNNLIVKPGETASETIKDNYTDEIDDATIPKGFTVSNIDGEKIIEDGLVIYDIPEEDLIKEDLWTAKNEDGTLKVQTDYNQLVWIPVNNSSSETFNRVFKRTKGYNNQSLGNMLEDCSEADANGINDKVTEDASIVEEAKKMYASVKQYGGFYIGRYESGIEGDTKRGLKSGITQDVVIKKNKHVYNYIGWSNSNKMKEVEGGAVEKSRKMTFANSNIDSSKTTLCYRVQWDAALNFIDPKYITGEVDENPDCDVNKSYVANSKDKGWYENNYKQGNPDHKTGIDLTTKANSPKNIYDMAGNVREWTMEACHALGRTVCGGTWNGSGIMYPASFRYYRLSGFADDNNGFRVTLYL